MKHISYVLQDEYDHLLQKKDLLEKQYKEQSKRKREACEQGAETRHDNADYEDAEYQQNLLGTRISHTNKIISDSKIVIKKCLSDNTIYIGSVVRLLVNGKKYIYTIGGNPTIPGRISYMSPLGKSIMGLKVGCTIKFIHDNIHKEITILSVN